jgi:group I intron endonuclease
MKIYYVYEILNPDTNQPFYVGWTSRSSELRFKEHIRETRNKIVNIDKVNIMKNLIDQGKEPFFKIVFETENKELSLKKEMELIDYYGRIKDGGILTNISKGGEHHSVSPAIKKRLSGYRKNKSYEELYGEDKASSLKKSLSERFKGSNNPMFGKTHTEESKKKMSEKVKGKIAHPISEYQKEKIRESNKNRIWSDEMRKKVSESQKKRYLERPESFKSYEMTDEHRKTISQARRSTANVYNFIHKDGSTFSGSIRQLSELVSSNPAEPWKLVKGQYKTHKGWRLAD